VRADLPCYRIKFAADGDISAFYLDQHPQFKDCDKHKYFNNPQVVVLEAGPDKRKEKK
jgi:hypothetical protein